MSTWTKQTVTCGCGAENVMRVALGIHVTRAPQVRDEVLARRLHYILCATCGTRLHARARFEYTDLERKQFVWVLPPRMLEGWRGHEEELRSMTRQAFELAAPMVSEVTYALRVRLVFSQEELREKLVVWTAGIEDGIVECLKVETFALDPTLAKPGSRLLVDAVEEDSLRCVWFERADDMQPARTVEIPAAWLHRGERDRASLASRFPTLFGDGFISANRLLVN